jgi:hypothetical protein
MTIPEHPPGSGPPGQPPGQPQAFQPPGAAPGPPPGFQPPGPGYPSSGGTPLPPQVPGPDGLGIAALCVGIASLIFGCPCGLLGAPMAVAAIVLGVFSLNRLKTQPGRFADSTKTLAISGIVAGGVALVFGTVMTLVGAAGQIIGRTVSNF